MNVGELFVSLGIKGAEKTVSALGNVQKGMQNVGSVSLEAKAAILGAVYALQRLVSNSGAVGTGLTNFSALTGESTKTLQQYQYAARQVGVSNQETENTFKTLQSTLTKMRTGGGAPAGFGQVSLLTGGITGADIDKFIQKPELLLQKLQEYAQKEKRLGVRNEALKSFGLSDNLVAGLSRQAFRPEALNKAPTYDDKEISQLDKANIAWSNLGNKIEMAIGHLNAAHGGQLVSDLSKLTDQILKLADAFIILADKAKIFEVIGKSFEGLTLLVGGLTNVITKKESRDDLKDTFSDVVSKYIPSLFLDFNEGDEKPKASQKPPSPEKKIAQPGSTTVFPIGGGKQQQPQLQPTQQPIKTQPVIPARKESASLEKANIFHPITKEIFSEKTTVAQLQKPNDKNSKLQLVPGPSPIATAASSLIPRTPASVRNNSSKTSNQNINIEQKFNYSGGEGKDASVAANEMKRQVKEAFRQLNSQVQGS